MSLNSFKLNIKSSEVAPKAAGLLSVHSQTTWLPFAPDALTPAQDGETERVAGHSAFLPCHRVFPLRTESVTEGATGVGPTDSSWPTTPWSPCGWTSRGG